jgi:hypothetical protein
MDHSIDQIAIRDSIGCLADKVQPFHLSVRVVPPTCTRWSVLQIVFLERNRNHGRQASDSRFDSMAYLDEERHKAKVLEVVVELVVQRFSICFGESVRTDKCWRNCERGHYGILLALFASIGNLLTAKSL